jgi:hypothetical protein
MRTKFWLESQKGRYKSDDLRVGARIILEWILEEEDGKLCTGFIWLRIGASGRHGNEPSDSIKDMEFS